VKKILLTFIALIFSSSLLIADEKPGRFFEDQPDVNDDYQIHFNYLLAAESEDCEWNINGKMETVLLEISEIMAKHSAKHKLANGISQKYKFDYRKDGKLDITFIRLDITRKQISDSPNNNIAPYLWLKRFNNPKKIMKKFNKQIKKNKRKPMFATQCKWQMGPKDAREMFTDKSALIRYNRKSG